MGVGKNFPAQLNFSLKTESARAADFFVGNSFIYGY